MTRAATPWPSMVPTQRQRGNQSGSELDDWLQADAEIRHAKE